MCTSEVGKGKGEVLEARCRVPGSYGKARHLLQNFSRNTHSGMERSTAVGEGHKSPEQLRRSSKEGSDSHGTYSQILPEEKRPEGLVSMKPQWNEDEGPGTPGFELAC